MLRRTSAGGSLATAVVRRLIESGRKERFAGQFLRIPVTCHPDVLPKPLADLSSSYYFLSDAPISPTRIMNDFWDVYDVGTKAASLDNSPLLATELKGFPPTYIAVAGCDPLRDQGIE
jgi:acetyl esterase/lipase